MRYLLKFKTLRVAAEQDILILNIYSFARRSWAVAQHF